MKHSNVPSQTTLDVSMQVAHTHLCDDTNIMCTATTSNTNSNGTHTQTQRKLKGIEEYSRQELHGQ
jgi:hypothetical protein